MMVMWPITHMKTLSNEKNYIKIIIAILVVLAFILIGFLIIEKIQQMEKEKKFSKEIEVDTSSDLRTLGYSGQRKIIQDGLGNIFIGYRKDYQRNSEIFVAKIYQDETGFHVTDTKNPIVTIDKNNDQRVPSLAIDAENTIHTVWYGSDMDNIKNNRQIKYSRKHTGDKNWESWRNIAYVSGYDNDDLWQEHPMILTGKDNMLYVVWEGKDEENEKQQIKFTKSSNGGTVWTKWKNIAPTKDNTQSRPTLIEDKTGKLFLLIYSSSGNENNLQQIQFISSADKGETWTNWQSISDPAFDARHISATVDNFEKIHVAWRAQTISNGPTQIIYRNHSGNKWSERTIVFPSKNYQFFPNIGTNESGKVYVSWMENPNKSGFPQENPASGFGLVSFLKREKFQTPIKLSEQKNILYPNVSEKIDIQNFVPIFYAEQISEEECRLKIKFLDSKE